MGSGQESNFTVISNVLPEESYFDKLDVLSRFLAYIQIPFTEAAEACRLEVEFLDVLSPLRTPSFADLVVSMLTAEHQPAPALALRLVPCPDVTSSYSEPASQS